MLREVKLPELAEGVETAVVVKVLVKPGDRIQRDQPLAELETEKATAEFPSPVAGVVREVHVEVGDEVRVGQVVVSVEVEQETEAEQPERYEQSEQPEEPEASEESSEEEESRPRREPGRPPARPGPARRGPSLSPGAEVPAGPAVRRLARELGLDVGAVPGSGPAGRISLQDVKEYARQIIQGAMAGPDAGGEAGPVPSQPELPDFSKWGEVEREPLSGVRRSTARSVARSWALVPHVTQHDRADITELERLRRTWRDRAEQRGARLSLTAIVLKVAASALGIYPHLNASLDLDNQELIRKRYVHIGVAVDTGQGLLVPVVRDADRKNILQIARELDELARQARAKRLPMEAMRGASFTVSNLGGLGTTDFSPIVTWPQVAVLGVGRAGPWVLPHEGRFRQRLVLPLSVSYDHRAIDGADAARFLRWIAEALEQPLKLALEG